MTRALLVAAVAVLAATTGAPRPALAVPVRLESHTIEPDQSRAEVRAVVAGTAARAGGGHLLLQLSGPVGDATRDALVRDGIALLRYVPDDAWVARVDPGAALSAASLAAITYAGTLSPRDKISASLRRPALPAWAVEPDGRLALRIRFHPDVSVAAGTRALAPTGAEVTAPLSRFPGVLARVAPDRLVALAGIDEVLWIEERLPPVRPENDGVRLAIGAEALYSRTPPLSGEGIKVAMWDTGIVDAAHADFGGRVVIVEPSAVSTHATHVAGTLSGSGALSSQQGGDPNQWRGVAPSAVLYCWNTAGDIIGETAGGTSTEDIYIVNNAWGFPVDGTNCDDYGDYRLLAPEFDDIVAGSGEHPVTIVFSAGNERNDGDCPLLDGGYACITPPKAAKNVIVVGATNSDDDSMTDFSSWGPVDDGRLKPDLTAPGCESSGVVTSTLPGDDYGTWCGTSMATPSVAGSIALIHQLHASIFGPSSPPRPASIKALLVATAEDLGNPGPDYAFGHGRIDVERAADTFLDATQLVFSVAQNQLSTLDFEVPQGSPPLRFALVWSDPDALPIADPALVNDLDLRLRDPAGELHHPWTLDPAVPSANAVRAADRLNNVEHVTVADPMPGTWTLEVWGHSVPEGPQLAAVAGLDLDAPAEVSGLSVDGTTTTSIDLVWTNPSASDFDGTLLVRAESAGAWTGPVPGGVYGLGEEVASGAVVVFSGSQDHGESPFTDGGLTEGDTYYYSAYAFDAMRNYSDAAITVGLAGGVVGVDAVGGVSALALGAPRPNPTRGETRIRFALPEAAVASVRVFDASGRHVVTLQRGALEAASYETRWDGRDAAGREVAPGVYYVALEAGAARLTKRVTLVH